CGCAGAMTATRGCGSRCDGAASCGVPRLARCAVCARVYDCDDCASSMPDSLVLLIGRSGAVVLGGAHLYGRDFHRDWANDVDLAYGLAVILYQDLAHALSTGQGTIYSAWHLVFKPDGGRFALWYDDIDIVRCDRLNNRGWAYLHMDWQWRPTAQHRYRLEMVKAPVQQLRRLREALVVRRRPENHRDEAQVAALGGRRQVEARLKGEAGLEPVASVEMSD